MEVAQAAPAPSSPGAASKTQLKYEICQVIKGLLETGAPQAWHGWDSLKTREFIQDVHGCHTGRSLAQLDVSATRVARAYGQDLQALLAARSTQ